MSTPILNYFHLHLVSDSTGETLSTIARAAIARYASIRPVEHRSTGVRTKGDLAQVLFEIEKAPGIVLHTMVNETLVGELEAHCRSLGLPCVAVLDPMFRVLDSYLGERQTPSVGAQYALDADYFRRIEAVNFTIAHDDGQNIDDVGLADIVLIGVSRTSKTPTSIYLANRGYRTANVPIIGDLPLPIGLDELKSTFVVGLIASPDRISSVREKRVQTMPGVELGDYVDRETIAREINLTRKLCSRNRWPLIDVTRRSIEETAAAVLDLYKKRG